MALRIVPRLTSRLPPSRPVRRASALRSSLTKQTIRLRTTAERHFARRDGDGDVNAHQRLPIGSKAGTQR